MKNLFFILALVVGLGFVAKETFLKKKEVYEPVACTMDARACPDGSYVGRVAPLCEFEKCPEIKIVDKSVNIGGEFTVGDISIKPIKIMEDSRCPTDVTCIQAGTVKVEAELTSGSKKQKMTLSLNTPIIFNEMKVFLKKVSPEPLSKIHIKQEDYKFEFDVVSQKIEQM